MDEAGTEEIDAKKLSGVSGACRNDTSCVEARWDGDKIANSLVPKRWRMLVGYGNEARLQELKRKRKR